MLDFARLVTVGRRAPVARNYHGAKMSENLNKLKAAYQAWNDTKGGSVETWLNLFAEAMNFRSLGGGRAELAFTGPRQSKADLRGYFDGLLGAWEMIHFTPRYFVEDGDHIVMFGRTTWRNKATGAVYDTAKADFWRFKDGKAVEFFEMYDTAAAQECARTNNAAMSA